VELKDPEHPASVVARGNKQRLTDFFRAEAERGGAADPALLARQLTLIFDGASARAGIKAEVLDSLAVTTALAVLDAAGMTARPVADASAAPAAGAGTPAGPRA
jgi:hypothetical protein